MYSNAIAPRGDDGLERYIVIQLEQIKMGINTVESASVELIVCSAQHNSWLPNQMAPMNEYRPYILPFKANQHTGEYC